MKPASALTLPDRTGGSMVLTENEIGEFIDAAVRDHVAARKMIEARPELLNARWMHNETILHFLAVEGQVDAVRFLAAAGAAIDEVNEFGDTPLIDVAVLGNAEIAKLLPRAANRSRSRGDGGGARALRNLTGLTGRTCRRVACRWATEGSLARALRLQERGHVIGGDANRVADPEVLEVAARAKAVDRRGAHAEQMSDLANIKQGLSGTPGGKMFTRQGPQVRILRRPPRITSSRW
jgi:hypothetical protein